MISSYYLLIKIRQENLTFKAYLIFLSILLMKPNTTLPYLNHLGVN